MNCKWFSHINSNFSTSCVFSYLWYIWISKTGLQFILFIHTTSSCPICDIDYYLLILFPSLYFFCFLLLVVFFPFLNNFFAWCNYFFELVYLISLFVLRSKIMLKFVSIKFSVTILHLILCSQFKFKIIQNTP